MPIPVSDKELEAKFGLLAAMLGGNEQMRHGMMGLRFEDALAVMARESNLSVATLKEALAKLSAEELAAHAKLMLEQTQQSAHALEEADVYTDALEDADSDDELPALVRSHFRFCPFPPRPRPIYASSFLLPENGRWCHGFVGTASSTQRRRIAFLLTVNTGREAEL